MEKVSDIMSEVLDAINGLCSCGLVADRLTESLLYCFPSSEQTVTFRAEIHGTIIMTASQLTMLMEKWIGNDPSINVLSVALNVDGMCDVIINSRSDGEQCAPPSSPLSSISIIAIAGGVIGGVILVIIIVACIISYIYRLSMQAPSMCRYPTLPMLSIHPNNTSYSDIPAIRSNTISTSHRQGLKETSYGVTTKEDQDITGELPTTRSHSVPMYASLGKDDKTKKGDVSSERNKDEAKIQLHDVGDLPIASNPIANGSSTNGQPTEYGSTRRSCPFDYKHELCYVQRARSKVNDTTANSTTYDVPPIHSHKEIASSEVNGRSPNPNYNMYSVPPTHPHQKMDSQTVNEGIANPNYSILPSKINSSGGNNTEEECRLHLESPQLASKVTSPHLDLKSSSGNVFKGKL